MYYSQSNQDKWVNEFYNNKKDGFFVEVGAFDGIQTSNTYFFEKTLGWGGVCIEANPEIFKRLSQNRRSINLNYAISDHEGECFFSTDRISENGYRVNCSRLDVLLKSVNCPRIIDYMSIDIEGHEYIALNNFNFSDFQVNLMTVEHNLYSEGSKMKDEIYHLLTDNGFTRVLEDVVCLDTNPLYFNKQYEDWYINNILL